jgi:hypothetical protein
LTGETKVRALGGTPLQCYKASHQVTITNLNELQYTVLDTSEHFIKASCIVNGTSATKMPNAPKTNLNASNPFICEISPHVLCTHTLQSIKINPYCVPMESRDSSVGIATGYGLDDRGGGVRVPVGSRIFTSPYRPDRLWGPPNLL